MSIAGPPGDGWPRFLHEPGFAEFGRNGPKSRLSSVSVLKIPPLRGLERDRAGSLPVHGTVSAGPETNRLPSSKIRCASPAYPARPGQPAHFSHDMAACFVAIIGSWENRLKPPHGVAGSLRSYAPPSWEKHCSTAPVSHRQPLGKSTFRPPPSAIGSLLGKPLSGHALRPPAASWENLLPSVPGDPVSLRLAARARRSSARRRAPASPPAAHPADAAVTMSTSRRRKSTCWGRFRHKPGLAQSARYRPKSRISPVPAFKIPVLRGLERDRPG